ncbi:ParB/RepB/Spo0J family partition protein [Streptomyces sp. WAC05292]|uniref:ParB/RepB/Spo0J family partition protein n=1 Tax=Streptomyces sp. WAC05292 TaxID=2487418 RepID=UPI000F735B39|nr:ParB/RepB/Spo0J family partition protein [Streptomyces sp. WAC05292]RSS97259.1 ParB/RepB/Spo0J family partition protein [Streptomyces sp. WAC05292]
MKPLKGAPQNRRGAGVGGQGTAPASPKPSQEFYSRLEEDGAALEIALSDISPNPFNDLRSMGDLDSLARSIKEDGLLQDIVVMHTTEFAKVWPEQAESITTKYVIAFGERRWRATAKAELSKIRAVLNNSVAEKIRRVLLIENLQRVGYTPMEEARNYHRLNTEEGLSYREISEAIKVAISQVSRRMKLLNLPEELQLQVDAGELAASNATQLLDNLETPEEREAAWRLMSDPERSLTVKAAIQAITSGYTPDGHVVQVAPDREAADVPEQRSETAAGTQRAAADAAGEEEPQSTQGQDADGTGEAPKQPAPRKTASAPAPVISAADRSARERNNAAADRTEACLHLIRSGFTPDDKQLAALFARTLLSPIQQGPAKTRGHAWLREAGREVLGVSDSDSYFQAVLSSGNDGLIQLATFVTALAASEIRAKDNRRQWDRNDAAHVELLIQAAGYRPQTQWERDQLDKFSVAYPTDEAADMASV